MTTPGNHAEPDLHAMMAELTRRHTHREPYEYERGGTRWSRYHPSEVPALVHQLVGAAPAGSKDESGSSSAKSRPAARIEALDTVMLIDDEAGAWIDLLGGVIPADRYDPANDLPIRGSGTVLRLLRLHGLHAGLNPCGSARGNRDELGAWCCQAHHLEHDVRRWWHQARIIAGWDSPSWRPDNTCPVCEQRRSLRINVEMQAGFCIECRTVWDSSQIGLLAEHIRTENGEDPGDGDTPTERSA